MATEEEDDKIARKMAKLKERNERKKQKQKVTAQPIFNKEVIEVGDNVRLKGRFPPEPLWNYKESRP